MKKVNLLLLFFLALSFSVQAQWTTITNGQMWYDNNGNEVQAHGAGFLHYNGRWYMVGEDRSDQWRPDVNMYSTTDFVNWRFENKIIENGVTHPDLGTNRFIERPKLLRCPSTGQFVVWCHWEQGNYGASEAAVFYSNTINGDYTFHWAGRPMGIKSRDCNVFVDNDGTAYFISTTSENTDLGLFRLSNDYLSVVSHTVLFDNQYREAPAIVRIGNTYYMISSGLTGWDPNQAKLATSTSLTGGWSSLTNVGNPTAFDTQAASILTIQGSQQTTYLYVGDRWMDPGLPESKTIIFPVSFSGNSMNFNYVDKFDINFSTGQTRSPSGGGLFNNSVVQLRNRGTGMVADGWGRTGNGDACAQQQGSSTHVNTYWRMIDAGSSYGTFYYLQNQGTGMKLDGYGRTSNGADAAQYANTTTHVNAQWIAEPFDNGHFRLRNRGTGLFIDGMGRTSVGAALGQYANTTHANAQWELKVISGARMEAPEIAGEAKIDFYPNPVSSVLTLDLPKDFENGVAKVFDINGKLIRENKISLTNKKLDMTSLRPGTYLLRITDNDFSKTYKFVKVNQ